MDSSEFLADRASDGTVAVHQNARDQLFLEAPFISPPKILLYSHDTFGLGNIRRTLLLANALREEFFDAAILIVTGSPVIHSFRIPPGVDYIKLPCLDRVEADQYEPRFLTEWHAEVKQTRRAILNKAILGFKPDLMIVDKRPTGIDGELLETIRSLKLAGSSTKLVLGVRDILDEPALTRQALKKQSRSRRSNCCTCKKKTLPYEGN